MAVLVISYVFDRTVERGEKQVLQNALIIVGAIHAHGIEIL